MIVYYSEYSMFVVGDDVPKWLPKWASQLKTIMSDLRLRNGNFPFQNRKGCELGLYSCNVGSTTLYHRRKHGLKQRRCPTINAGLHDDYILSIIKHQFQFQN